MTASAAVAEWDEHGFVVLPGFLPAGEIAAAVAELPTVFPTPDELHDDVDPERNARFRSEFGGIVDFLLPSVEVSLVCVHPRLVDLAAALLRTDDLRLVSAEAWAKYTGAADYEQELHRDYLNHTPLVPTDDRRFRQVEMFVFLSDVTAAHGPPRLLSRTVTGARPALPNWFAPGGEPRFDEAEVAATGPAGTVVAFEIGTFHRGTRLTAARGARFSLHVNFRPAVAEWAVRHGWADRAHTPEWRRFVPRASPRQLALFGFPPPATPTGRPTPSGAWPSATPASTSPPGPRRTCGIRRRAEPTGAWSSPRPRGVNPATRTGPTAPATSSRRSRSRRSPVAWLTLIRRRPRPAANDRGVDDQLTALLDFDRDHVWHPYTSIPGAVAPILVESAAGTRLRVVRPPDEPRELVDAMASWWSAIHGYSHPALIGAAAAQLGEMSHVMFGGLTHRPAVALARRLVEITPDPLECVFFSDSGSVAVEVALKMALQHWHSQGLPRKRRLLTWRGGYHGDTLFAMSVCDPEDGMHALWSDVIPTQVFTREPPGGVATPVDEAFVAELEACIAAHADELAAVVVEPVVQGAGGMRFHNPDYLARLRKACTEHDVLLIFDEIATGFGRTGRLFAAEWAGVTPDVMCVGKAMTGGMLSLAATLCTRAVADGIASGTIPVLAHGPTYMGNPLACATALAAIDLLFADDWAAQVAGIEQGLGLGLAPAAGLPGVADVRVLGAIGVVELDHPVDMAAATQAAYDEGVWLRPFRNLVYTMPPYVSSDADIDRICRAMLAVCAVA